MTMTNAQLQNNLATLAENQERLQASINNIPTKAQINSVTLLLEQQVNELSDKLDSYIAQVEALQDMINEEA